jgi:Tfp pilus assembly protein PilW
MSRRRQRRGVVFFELIIALPIVMIFLAAVIQFALIKINIQHVSMASRIGAKRAAAGDNAALVKTAVDRYLDHAGFGAGASAGVTVRDSGAVSDSTSGTCTSIPAFTTLITSSKVRVCLNLNQLTPNLLDVFGYDITGKTFQIDTTFPQP